MVFIMVMVSVSAGAAVHGTEAAVVDLTNMNDERNHSN